MASRKIQNEDHPRTLKIKGFDITVRVTRTQLERMTCVKRRSDFIAGDKMQRRVREVVTGLEVDLQVRQHPE